MVDPRQRDSRFPNRPTHEDFVRLSEAVQSNDARAEAGEEPGAIAGVDPESLVYMASNRIAMAVGGKPGLTLDMLLSLYVDAFTLGKAFAAEECPFDCDRCHQE